MSLDAAIWVNVSKLAYVNIPSCIRSP